MCYTGGEADTSKERTADAWAHADEWEVSALFHESSHVPFRLWEEHPTTRAVVVVNDTVTVLVGRIRW